MAKILLIEDMKGVRESLEVILQMAGHTLEVANDGAAGLQKIGAGSYDLIITDILMPEVDGTEVIIQSKQSNPSIPVLAISAGGNGVSADQALEIASQKANAVLVKPFSKDELLNQVNTLIG